MSSEQRMRPFPCSLETDIQWVTEIKNITKQSPIVNTISLVLGISKKTAHIITRVRSPRYSFSAPVDWEYHAFQLERSYGTGSFQSTVRIGLLALSVSLNWPTCLNSIILISLKGHRQMFVGFTRIASSRTILLWAHLWIQLFACGFEIHW